MTPTPRCPIRRGDTCSLCVPAVSGPQDCGLAYLVMSDPDLHEQWNEGSRAAASTGAAAAA